MAKTNNSGPENMHTLNFQFFDILNPKDNLFKNIFDIKYKVTNEVCSPNVHITQVTFYIALY